MGRKKTLFSGCGVALVTPFLNGEIDYASLGDMIDFQISSGTDSIVILGTTGESPTVTEDERERLIPFAKERIASKVPLIVGCGSNCTDNAVRLSKRAEELGADGILTVTPYYNKASGTGLTEHYKKIAAAVSLPIIIYNVPSRTGVNVPMSVYNSLSEVDNIVAVKEAGGDISYDCELISRFGDYFDIYSGCDDITVPMLSLGAKGVISVAANIVPSRMHQMCYEFFSGNMKKSIDLQYELMPLIKELFAEVNPIPIKTALSIIGLCSDEFRLPMCQSARKEQIHKILKKYSLI